MTERSNIVGMRIGEWVRAKAPGDVVAAIAMREACLQKAISMQRAARVAMLMNELSYAMRQRRETLSDREARAAYECSMRIAELEMGRIKEGFIQRGSEFADVQDIFDGLVTAQAFCGETASPWSFAYFVDGNTMRGRRLYPGGLFTQWTRAALRAGMSRAGVAAVWGGYELDGDLWGLPEDIKSFIKDEAASKTGLEPFVGTSGVISKWLSSPENPAGRAWLGRMWFKAMRELQAIESKPVGELQEIELKRAQNIRSFLITGAADELIREHMLQLAIYAAPSQGCAVRGNQAV